MSLLVHVAILMLLALLNWRLDDRSSEPVLAGDWSELRVPERLERSLLPRDATRADGGGSGDPVPMTLASSLSEPIVRLRDEWPLESQGPEPLSPAVDTLGESIAGRGFRHRGGTGRGDGLGNGDGSGNGNGLSFFDLPASGSKFVFVLDCSGSMTERREGGDCRLDLVKHELVASIAGLPEENQFFIIFFNTFSVGMEAKTLQRATLANKKRHLKWAVSRQGGGGTDPRLALAQAFDLQPDVVYLLTDGQFDTEVSGEVDRLNTSRVVVHTICLGDPRGEPGLKRIAQRHSGSYKFVP